MGLTHARTMTAVALAASILAPAARAQGADGANALAAGQTLYEANCAICHQSSGAGRPPAFPDLRGNDILADPYVLVSKVAQGLGNMPPFPTLTAEEIAALATYVGSAWGNSYGAPTEAEVAEILADFDPPMAPRSIWDGVYTEAQAERGAQVYRAPCGICHGTRLNGAPDDNDMIPGPALARHNFLRIWDGRSLGMLYTYTISTMPQSNPGFLPPEDYAAIIAHMLAVTGAPPGDAELPADAWELGHIQILPAP
ncbi:c-type cytochrome [Roseicyclus mahoneyensis]|jgi:mono/diheme cytochrome c family protein|uniref:Mono/diheme cytochrome c family protein n=1 Tax=Roseicyclus mahoneyensis TaxID=164332 RepID=A0A316H489_9RHOB|nr:c-type cytochrome [Roseicyclus mahoneyensis]PWK62383.1 mono/diheme cytochrome c family protein [Roseicyclus mahoneyensis]